MEAENSVSPQVNRRMLGAIFYVSFEVSLQRYMLVALSLRLSFNFNIISKLPYIQLAEEAVQRELAGAFVDIELVESIRNRQYHR